MPLFYTHRKPALSWMEMEQEVFGGEGDRGEGLGGEDGREKTTARM